MNQRILWKKHIGCSGLLEALKTPSNQLKCGRLGQNMNLLHYPS